MEPEIGPSGGRSVFNQIAGDSGPPGSEILVKRRDREREIGLAIIAQYRSQALLGDAIQEFYFDTLQEVARAAKQTTPSGVSYLFIQLHVLCSTRLFATWDLFGRGYFFEATMLARSLWETALSIVALRRGVVSESEVFGAPSVPAVPESELRKAAIKQMKATDRKIWASLIESNTQLDPSVRQGIKDFLYLLNAATHKNMGALALNMCEARDGQATDILPKFERRRVESTLNLMFSAFWCVFATLPFLRPFVPGVGTPWDLRWQTTMKSFDSLVGAGPAPVVKAFHEFVHRVCMEPSCPPFVSGTT